MDCNVFTDSIICNKRKRYRHIIPKFGKDWLIIIGCVLAPMTSWRVWKIGPGEVCCFLWAILNLKYIIWGLKLDEFVRFWFLFLTCAILGAGYGSIFYPDETILKDLLTWLYLGFIACSVKYRFAECDTQYVDKIVLSICVILPLFQIFLFEYSNYVSSYFYGAQLWFGGHARYSGGGLNPHQIAMPLAVMGIITLRYVIQYKNIILKIFFVLLSIIDLFLLNQTVSSTGLAAFVCGFFVTLVLYLRRAFKLPTPWVITIIFIVLLGFIVFFEKFYGAFMDWMASDPNGMDRLDIFSTFPTAFAKGPIFGLGPGTHARNGIKEFHNSYLEIFAMSGFIGFFAYMLFIMRLLMRSFNVSPSCFGGIITLCVFGCAGFDARRLVYWVMVSLVFCLCSPKGENASHHSKYIRGS